MEFTAKREKIQVWCEERHLCDWARA
jgi:hypothetical protein